MHLYGCSGNDNQAWVKAADGTLRLPSGYCLTGAGTGNGAAVLVRDCAVTDTAEQWTYNTSTHALVNKASGRCLDVLGSDGTSGTALDLRDCHGGANQQWTVPATYWPHPATMAGRPSGAAPSGAVTGGLSASVFSHARWVIGAFRCGDRPIGRRCDAWHCRVN
ncbi:RICIN domain-containing protein [Streptomyces sp. NBC_01589]|uniref:ricin-type beta-trefoil lectin domain protein n=1 Tax=Streptomyces sp. NBC_01589 TaxID=2975886 RepID=UPI0038671045